MRVSVLQMTSIDDKAANLEQARRLIEAAVAEDRPDLVALPEIWPFQGGTVEQRRAAAEPLPDGPAYALLQECAARHRILIHGGSLHERDGEQIFNTTVAFDRDGSELARYRKIHRFDIVTPDGRAYRESDLIGAGREIVTYEAEGLRVGCSICYDVRFPELYRRLADAGAQLLMVPAAFTLETGKDHWEVLQRARAIETGCWLAAPAQVGAYTTGSGETRSCWGHAMIVDPWGQVRAQVPYGRGFATARVDLGYLERVREMIPVHQHRVLGG